MTKKDIAVNFLKLASAGRVREAYDKYVQQNFIHHNPYFAGDRESLMKAMEEAHARNPNKLFEVKHSLEDKDMVVTHSYVQQNNGIDIVVVHIFRFKNNKIIELWDVSQFVSEDSPNENGIF